MSTTVTGSPSSHLASSVPDTAALTFAIPAPAGGGSWASATWSVDIQMQASGTLTNSIGTPTNSVTLFNGTHGTATTTETVNASTAQIADINAGIGTTLSANIVTNAAPSGTFYYRNITLTLTGTPGTPISPSFQVPGRRGGQILEGY